MANAVKSSSFSHRQTTLVKGLQSITDKLLGPFTLPLNPAMVAKGISIEVFIASVSVCNYSVINLHEINS